MSLASSYRVGFFPKWFDQAVLGLVLGGSTAFWLHSADPLKVMDFPLPLGADFAQYQAAYDHWKWSARVIIGQAVMTFIPILVSGTVGIFAYRSLPSSIPAALLRMIGVTSFLSLISTVGLPIIDYALSTGESSDIQTPLTMLAFVLLCITLASPLTSAIIHRRSQEGHAPVEITR